ncbi:Crp/Fnr family transcriptional regulator [Alteribacillus sp. YIM 98480]|uniref:Crp/Fnr family transcriptional regulator n=1 Tax=Alteribacillus sp. YIM 98480 TaxID=2606599 RepID=UPI00131B2C79|nr:Crp/Fnr family transcriptional regulator [Alteribacillus sp. YIM 98480]
MGNKPGLWENYIEYGQMRRLPKNATLFRQGEQGNGFYYLHEGEVKISMLREDGHVQVIDYVSPGELIGEQGVTQGAYFTSADVTKESILYYFSISHFRKLCSDYPETIQEFSYSLISKIRMLVKTKSIFDAPAEAQLAFHLHFLYKKTGSPTITLDQISISNYIGKSRVTIWKILKEWRKGGIIETYDRTIYIKNVKQLEQKINQFL